MGAGLAAESWGQARAGVRSSLLTFSLGESWGQVFPFDFLAGQKGKSGPVPFLDPAPLLKKLPLARPGLPPPTGRWPPGAWDLIDVRDDNVVTRLLLSG